jgi:hypothetical protein
LRASCPTASLIKEASAPCREFWKTWAIATLRLSARSAAAAGELLVQGPEYAGSEYDEDEADRREIAREVEHISRKYYSESLFHLAYSCRLLDPSDGDDLHARYRLFRLVGLGISARVKPSLAASFSAPVRAVPGESRRPGQPHQTQ